MKTAARAMGSLHRFGVRCAVVALALAVLGLPVTSLLDYFLLLALVVLAWTGSVSADLRRWLYAIALAVAVLAGHLLFPAPRIEEGFNVALPLAAGSKSALPAEVQRVISEQLAAEFPPGKNCADQNNCAHYQQDGTAPAFSFSADSVFERAAFSRRTTGIGFSSPVWLRAGVINDLAYNIADGTSDFRRFERDRRSFNFVDRFKLTLPLYIAYRFPADFSGSDLCWRGTVLWERADGGYAALNHADLTCRSLEPQDIGRTIYALAIAQNAPLTMSLHANATILLRRAIEWGLTLIGLGGIGWLLLRIERRRLLVPAILIGAAVVLTTAVDVHFLGGFRPLDGGDDGIMYEGFARDIVRNILSGDIASALRGGEATYYFTPGFRYFRALELFLFGDTFLGYFSAIAAFPFVLLALARRFLNDRWALGFVLLFTVTPAGVLFGSTFTDYITAASRGYGDPFAFLLLLLGFVFVIPKLERAGQLHCGRAFLGAMLLAMATFCRPNLVLAAGTMTLCALAMTIHARQFAAALAVFAGFATLAVSPLHNIVFGGSTILFSDNVNQPQTLLMPPLDYLRAIWNIVTLDFASPYVSRAFAQLGRWLAGTHKLAIAIPVNLAAVVILLRVGVFGRAFDPWLRAVALVTMLQHAIGACYVNYDRYNLVTWLLTALVSTVWLRQEGLPWLESKWPAFCARAQGTSASRRVAGWLDDLVQKTGFSGQQS